MAPLPTPLIARRRRPRGLTLVEFMLVVGLLGVLLSLGFSGWKAWRDRVDTATAQGQIIAMGVAIDAHYEDTGSLPASLDAVGFGGATDPWGNAYVYLNLTSAAGKGKARKDHSLVPLNSDYDLYSKGPDGQSAAPLTAASSRDDILRANNGRFVGPASEY
jgi:general secretion pathway protein G